MGKREKLKQLINIINNILINAIILVISPIQYTQRIKVH